MFQDASTLSPDLAKASIALSVTAYDRANINTLLTSMGFTTEDNQAVYDKVDNGLTITDFDYVAYTIAHTELVHPLTQEPYIIYCVPIQGTKVAYEWISDGNLGEGVEHEGFRNATMGLALELQPYMTNDAYDKDHTILWLTGHSRGAACANLLAGWYNEYNHYVSRENLFTYTFACPAVSKEADMSLTNIFNFNNPGDVVTLVPLPEWGYFRYGQTIELDTSTMGYGNFAQQFQRVKGDEYKGKLGDEYYQPILSSIGKDENFSLVMSLMGWSLSGGQVSDLLQILEKHSGKIDSVIKEAIMTLLPQTVVAITIYELADLVFGLDEQNAELMDWAYDAYKETWEMVPEGEEFSAFLKNNSEMIKKLEAVSDVTISAPGSLQEAYNRLKNDSHKIIRTLNTLHAIHDLVLADGSLTAFSHGHDRITYHTWINSMFYGWGGWQNNQLITAFPLEDGINVMFPLDDSFYSIGENCFYNCNNLTAAVVPNTVTSLGSRAFADCSNLKSLTLPVDLKTGDAFYWTSGIKTIRYTPGRTGVMPNRSNSNYTCEPEVESCNSLEEVIFEDGITHIGAYLMKLGTTSTGYSRKTLTSVTLPATLESVGEKAFYNCYNAVFNEWPTGVNSIGANAFYWCYELGDLTFTGDAPTIGNSAFYNVTTTAYYPQYNTTWATPASGRTTAARSPGRLWTAPASTSNSSWSPRRLPVLCPATTANPSAPPAALPSGIRNLSPLPASTSAMALPPSSGTMHSPAPRISSARPARPRSAMSAP